MAFPHDGKKANENVPIFLFCPTRLLSFNTQVLDHSNSMFDSNVECLYEGGVCLCEEPRCCVMIFDCFTNPIIFFEMIA